MKFTFLVVALLMSAFFSGAETAFVSVSIVEAQVWLRQKITGARWVYYFISRPHRYLITTLIGTNVAVIAFSSISTYYLEPHLNKFLILLFNSFFLLIFGEIIPKTLFRQLAHSLVKILALPLLFFRVVFHVIYLMLNMITGICLRLLGQTRPNLSSYFTRHDLEILLREGEKGGVIDPEERKIITRVFRLSHRRVREVIVPRTEIVSLPRQATIQQAKQQFIQSGFSRLPVIGQNLDDIIGVVYAKDLLTHPGELHDIFRQVFFVPQSILCSELLRKMQARHITFAVALDEFGGTAGIVTLEDLVEELFGEITDEFDERMVRMKPLPDGSLLVSARTEIHLVNDEMKWDLPLGKYETIGGMILEHLGRIPRVNESFRFQNYRITVIRGDRHKLRFVKIKPVVGRESR